MSIFRDFFVKEKPVFTGITRGIGGFGFGKAAAGGGGQQVTGGTAFPIGDYDYRVFSAGDSALGLNSGTITYDILVVAGGGAGGTDKVAGACGGGGGGATIYATNQTLSTGDYNIFVGSITMEAVEVEVEVEENPGKQSSNSFIKIEHIEGVYNLLVNEDNEDNKIHIGHDDIKDKIKNNILDACFRIFPSTKEKLEEFIG